jgi:hypothetical protein
MREREKRGWRRKWVGEVEYGGRQEVVVVGPRAAGGACLGCWAGGWKWKGEGRRIRSVKQQPAE